MNNSFTSLKLRVLNTFSKLLEKFGFISSSNQFGVFEGEEFIIYEKVYRILQPRNFVVVDVGANTGAWANNFSRIFDSRAYMHCIEPMINDDLFNYSKNNKMQKFYLLAIGEGVSKEIFFSNGGGSAYVKIQSNLKNFNAKKFTKKLIPCVSGDAFVNQHLIYPDLIKIDTDGMDFEVMRSFKHTINFQSPIIQFEYTKRFAKRAGYSLKANIKFLNENGYQTFVIDKNSNLNKVRSAYCEVLGNQTKNFLALHKVKHHNLITNLI